MSQQTNAGFNAPGFSVVPDDPGGTRPSGSPVTTCATRCGSGIPVSVGLIVPFPLLASCATGVGQSAASACARIATSPAEFPASLFLLRAGASEVGVGHSARAVSSRACIASPISRPSAIRRSIPGK